MNSNSIFVCLLVIAIVVGCADTGSYITTTKAPEIDQIPRTIAVYPLLTSEVKRHIYMRPVTTKTRENKLYISPPVETKLVVNLQSQMMTGLLSSELSYVGFSLKELPVEVPDTGSESGDNKNTFYISLEMLRHLKENYGLQAVLLGNVYFTVDRYDPTKALVKAAYLKVVDVETLDVLSHVSLSYDEYGIEMDQAASVMAAELADLANLSPKNKAE